MLAKHSKSLKLEPISSALTTATSPSHVIPPSVLRSTVTRALAGVLNQGLSHRREAAFEVRFYSLVNPEFVQLESRSGGLCSGQELTHFLGLCHVKG